MFFGQHRIFLSHDKQLAVPEFFRALATDGVYVTRGFENNLMVMSNKFFQELYKRTASLNIADPQARLFLRLMLGNVSRLDLQPSGTLAIPQDLMEFASLENEVVLVGQGEYCEVWAPGNWEKQSNKMLDFEANAERFSHLDLAF